MKKLLLFVTILLTVQLMTAAAYTPLKKNTGTNKTAVSKNVHSRRAVSIIVNSIYIHEGISSPLCIILSTASAYALNQTVYSSDLISCPSSTANIVVAVGDQIVLRYKPRAGSGNPVGYGFPHTVTQADIDKGTVDLYLSIHFPEH